MPMKWTLALLLIPNLIFAQNKYGLTPMKLEAYRKSVVTNPQNELVNLEKFIPGIELSIGYATTNNFTGTKIYNLARAYSRRPVAEALKNIQADLKKQGLELKIFDGYRPYSATVMFYETYHDTTYVASPHRGSKHNRGCALDLTIIDSKTRKELEMPTGWDSFKKDAWPSTPVADPVVSKNRKKLIDIMEKNGFKVSTSEWWHFDFVGWQNFTVMDIDFEELEND